MKYLTTFLLLFLATNLIFGQNIIWNKYLQGGRQNNVSEVQITTDFEGNSYVIGSFENNITYGSRKLYSKGKEDIYIAKFKADGTFEWMTHIGGSAQDIGFDIALNSKNNPIIGGHSKGRLIIGEDTSSYRASVVAELNASTGNIVWYKFIQRNYYCTALDLDVYDNIYIVGEGSDIPDSGVVQKLDKKGEQIWYQEFFTTCTSSGTISFLDMEVDRKGNVYVIGRFDCGDLIIGDFTLAVLPPDGTAAQLALFKLDTEGNPIWAESSSVSLETYPIIESHAITVDDEENVYVAIMCNRDIILGGQFYPVTDFGVLAKFNNQQQWEWVRSDAYDQYHTDLTIDCSGRLFAAGIFTPHSGDHRILFETYNTTTGNRLDADTIGFDAYGRGIGIDGYGNIYLGGIVRNDLNGFPIDNNATILLKKYVDATTQAIPPIPSVDDIIYVCPDEIVPEIEAIGQNIEWYDDIYQSNLLSNQSIFQPTNITDTIYFVNQTINGCESWAKPVKIQSVELPEVNIRLLGDRLYAELSDSVDVIKWLIDGKVIDDANTQYTNIEAAGLYEVEIIKNDCSEIYDFEITDDLFQSLSKLESVKIYPNPTTSYITIDHTKYRYNTLGTIYNLKGQLLKQFEIIKGTNITTIPLDVRKFQTGLYFIHFSTNDEYYSMKFMVR